MFKKLVSRVFGNPDAVARDLPAHDPERWESVLLDRVKEMSAEDPLIGAKLGGKELAHRLIDAMTDHRGIHVESLMCAAGALAGYSCQAALRAKNRADGLNELAHFTEARTSDGQTFLFLAMRSTKSWQKMSCRFGVWQLEVLKSAVAPTSPTSPRSSRTSLIQ